MVRKKSLKEASAISPDKDLLSPEQAQIAHDQALTTMRSTCVIPEIAAARERMKADLARRLHVTKQDLIAMFLDAIDDAKLLADPSSQIKGIREIGLMMGHYEPQVVTLRTEGPLDKVRESLKQMTLEQLQDLAGEDVLDADFYVVKDRARKIG